MSFPEIRPGEVPPGDARRILDFLNTAESAAAIAARIELPNEPDVGPRIAEHILARRAELGSFTSLDQLLTVRLVGPVRFTRIVRSLVGALPVGTVDREAFDGLADEVRSLHGVVEALAAAAAPPRVRLAAVEPTRYLGQPQTLIATVSGADGLRRAGVPVTLSATWGRLRGSDGFSVQEGTSLTLRAAGDGTVQATLLPPTSEDLQATQQAAVEAMLGMLAADAAGPQDAGEGLTALVRAYRFDANDDFRAGVDIYFRDFHQHLLESVNFRRDLEAWATFDSAVVAYLQDLSADGALETGVQAAAAMVVRFRDWLAPWLQAHIALADSETLLAGELRLATNLEKPTDMITHINRRVGEFVSLQRGLVGQVVGQKVAEAKLGGFLDTGIDALPEQTKRALFPAVATSSTTVGTLGLEALSAVAQTREDLRRGVRAEVVGGLGGILEESPVFAGLRDAVAAKVDQATFDAAIAGKVDRAALDAAVADKVDRATFDAAIADRVDRATFDAAIADRVDRATFDAAIAGKVDRATFDTALAAKLDVTTVDEKLRAATNFADFRTSLTEVIRFRPGGPTPFP